MAQEEKQHGVLLNPSSEVSGSVSGDGACTWCIHRKVWDTPISEYPKEAIITAVNNFSAGFVLCSLVVITLCFLYPDRVGNAITVLGPLLGAAITWYFKLRDEKARKQ
ncbi:MAG: hypothetical protein KGL39_50290 [Patescibacteria group bacterium]|nr:hypothetical protein [Patescibacteria group bacterium]